MCMYNLLLESRLLYSWYCVVGESATGSMMGWWSRSCVICKGYASFQESNGIRHLQSYIFVASGWYKHHARTFFKCFRNASSTRARSSPVFSRFTKIEKASVCSPFQCKFEQVYRILRTIMWFEWFIFVIRLVHVWGWVFFSGREHCLRLIVLFWDRVFLMSDLFIFFEVA